MRVRVPSLVLIIVLVVFAPLLAEEEKGQTMQRHESFIGAPAKAMPLPAPGVFAGGDVMFDMKIVTGAPYSAEAVSETVQTLSDGNRIVRRNTTQMYRDSEGRTRQEFSFPLPAPDGSAEAGSMTIISITDLTAGVSYTLHPDTKTAEKILLPGPMGEEPFTKPLGEDVAPPPPPGERRIVIRALGGPGAGPLPGPMPGADVIGFRAYHVEEQDAVTEPLGSRVIEGVDAEGKLTTTTIPAGQIGNEAPIVITNEVWTSPELQTIVYSKRNDPLAGQTTFRLTSISRGNPDPALFQVPADYKVTEPQTHVIRGLRRSRR